MNEVLVKVYVPMIEEKFEILIPIHRRIYNVIYLLLKAVNELSDDVYKPEELPELYDRMTGKKYDINLSIKESNIRNATELILI